jgi:hypothetical protein
MKTAITISIKVKPRFASANPSCGGLATGRVRPTRRGTIPSDSPPDESVRLADSRIGGQRRIGQVTPCAPNHKTARKTGVSRRSGKQASCLLNPHPKIAIRLDVRQLVKASFTLIHSMLEVGRLFSLPAAAGEGFRSWNGIVEVSVTNPLEIYLVRKVNGSWKVVHTLPGMSF